MQSKEKTALHHTEIAVEIDTQHCIQAKLWMSWANCSFEWQSWRRMLLG